MKIVTKTDSQVEYVAQLLKEWGGRLQQSVPLLLLLGGIGAILLAVAADGLGIGGGAGFGLKQTKLVWVGGCLLVSGLGLILTQGRHQASEWLLLAAAAVVLALAGSGVDTAMWASFGWESFGYGVGTVMLVVAAVTFWPAPRHVVDGWLRLLALDRANLGKLLVLVLQLALVGLVAVQFELENTAFHRLLLPLTFYGFIVHAFLPVPYRQPFFVLLSLAAIAGVFGFINGLWLVGLGVGLIALCHLPLPLAWRVTLVVLAGAALAFLRSGLASAWLTLPWSAAIWPILGSMFMFRLMVYLYDLPHQKEPVRLRESLAYFFLLPNVVFPLFPVVDFSTFRRTYDQSHDQAQHFRTYQTGITWMVRGVVQLLLYRYISYYWLIGPEDVTNTTELVQYLVTNFLLYLRVSGQFHLIVGILHLFGFNLPETHHLYYLASSFTDFWRRINIYWKDFMLKLFYYPAYFRLRKLGATSGMVLATLFVFVATWFLHAYQWFWLRGAFLLAWQDVLFWTLLAVLVVVNSLYEVKRGRKRTLGHSRPSTREVLSLALRTALTFAALCILWSLWTSTSLADWFALWSVLDFSWQNLAVVLAPLLVVGVIAGWVFWRERNAAAPVTNATPSSSLRFYRSAAVALATLVCLFLLGQPFVASQTSGKTQEVLLELKVAKLNAQDAELLERGYYEDLMGVDRFNGELWEIYTQFKAKPDLEMTGAVRRTDNILRGEFIPSQSLFYGDGRLSTNQWGMRDKEYEQQKPPSTYRIALIGSSHSMGWGVGDDETFEGLLEERLNRENSGATYEQYEILNFAFAGYGMLQRLYMFETRATLFQPDSVLYVAHVNEVQHTIDNLVEGIPEGMEIPYPFARDIVARAGVDATTPETQARRQLSQFSDELISATYSQLVQEANQLGILPVWILLPRTMMENPDEVQHLNDLAQAAGFLVISLSDVYDGQDLDSLRLNKLDGHPNAAGHQLIADRLYDELLEHQAEIPLNLQ